MSENDSKTLKGVLFMICSSCGAQNADGAQNCQFCGTPLTTNQQFNGAQQQFNGQPGQVFVAQPAPNIQKKDIVKMIILSIVTCGIYGIIWFINLTDDTNLLSQEPSPTSGGTAFLLTLVTCGIYGFYWAYKRGERLDKYAASLGRQGTNNAVLYLVLQIVGLGIVAYVLMQNELNKIADGTF